MKFRLTRSPLYLRLFGRSVNLIPWRFRTIIRRIPLVAGFQRWAIARLFEGKEFVHVINAGPAKGLIYPVMLPQDKNIWTGTYESHFATALAARIQPGDVCYDIGGFRGFMTGVMARAGAKLVIAFEPLPANGVQIRRMAELNPALAIRLEAVAIGDRDGDVEFKVMPEDSMGKLADSPFQPLANAATSIMVPIRRLDDMIATAGLPPPNVIKIDVEGAELLALQGASQLLRQHRPILLIEAHSPQLTMDCTAFLESFEYRVSVLESASESSLGRPTEVRHLFGHPQESDASPSIRAS